GRITRLQLTRVMGARSYLQADILRLGAKPQLARIQRHLLAAKASAEIVVSRDVDQSGFLAVGRRRPVLAAPQRRTELNPFANNRFVRGVDDRLTDLGLDAFPDIGVNIGPAGYVADLVRLALQDPEDRVASWMDQALDRPAVPLQVDQHWRLHLVPIPRIVLMVLEMCLDLAGLGIEAEHGGCIEVVTGVGVPGPRRSITDTPINGLGVLVIVAGHPGRSAAGFPVVASPGVMAGFAGAGDGEGPPQFLAAVGVIRDDIAPDAEFAAGAADNDLSVDDQRHQGQVLTLLVVLDLGVPEDLARFGIKRDDMIVCRRQIQLVLPQPDSAAGRVQLEEIVRQLAFVPPVLFA